MASAKPSISIPRGRKELKLIALGGCYGVESSSYILLIDGHCMLLDAGYNDKGPLDFNLLESHKPEAVFITHAHLDHVGSLPIVHRMFPDIHIYMTSPTKTLASTILLDAMHVASLRKKDLYTKEQINETLEHVVTVEFGQKFNFGNLRVVFRCAGHILGAAYILIEGSRKVLYTGDFSSSAFLVTPPAYIPSTPEVVDLLITESTYGGSQLPPRESEVDDFCSEVKNVIQRGGRVLIPSFALGRAQEVLTILLKEMDEGRLEGVPVILDGMARVVAEHYDEYSDYLAGELYHTCRRSMWLRTISGYQERERMINNSAASVIIASSGMLTGGPSVAYAEKILSEEKSAILIVGYLDEEAPGKEVVNSKLGKSVELLKEDEEGGNKKIAVTRRCEVREYKLSAHSDQQGLVRFGKSYQPLAVFLVHGEIEHKVSLSKAMMEAGLKTVLIPKNGEEIDVDNLIHPRSEIKLTEAKGPVPDLDKVCEKVVDELHNTPSGVTFDVFKEALDNTGLLAYCCSSPNAEQIVHRLFAWSFKYTQTVEGLNFEFPSLIFSNGARLLRLIYGEILERKFLSDFKLYLPGMFKNLILSGGPIRTREKFQVHIESKQQLSNTMESFEKHFGELGIHVPEVSSIQTLCERRVKKIKDSTKRKIYEKIFGGTD